MAGVYQLTISAMFQNIHRMCLSNSATEVLPFPRRREKI